MPVRANTRNISFYLCCSHMSDYINQDLNVWTQDRSKIGFCKFCCLQFLKEDSSTFIAPFIDQPKAHF